MRFALAAASPGRSVLGGLCGPGACNLDRRFRDGVLSGAEVMRLAKVKIDKGEHTIIFSDVPASAVPGSIRVEGKATGKLDIGSVDTARKLLQRAESQAADATRKALEDQIEQLRDQKAGLEAQAQAAKTQKTLIANLAELPTRPCAAGDGRGTVERRRLDEDSGAHRSSDRLTPASSGSMQSRKFATSIARSPTSKISFLHWLRQGRSRPK